MRKRGIVALLAALLFSSMAAAAPNAPRPDLNRAQKLFFYTDHLKGTPKGSRLDYAFKSLTKGADSFTDSIEIKVTDVIDEARRDLEFNFLSGERHIDFASARAYTGNPVVIHFLERDISRMARDTGGSNGFFRNRIRDSFKHPQELLDISIDFQGKKLDGTKIVVTPFVKSQHEENFKLYTNKRYEFIFSEQIPGGIYRVRTQVPDDAGRGTLIEEAMTFRKITPAL